MLDINLFRAEKGFDPEIVRESQRRRFASVEIVDEIINLDKEWRQRTLFWIIFVLFAYCFVLSKTPLFPC
jgi:Seryl-tRNA synthetase N-terminal domain